MTSPPPPCRPGRRRGARTARRRARAPRSENPARLAPAASKHDVRRICPACEKASSPAATSRAKLRERLSELSCVPTSTSAPVDSPTPVVLSTWPATRPAVRLAPRGEARPAAPSARPAMPAEPLAAAKLDLARPARRAAPHVGRTPPVSRNVAHVRSAAERPECRAAWRRATSDAATSPARGETAQFACF